MRQITQGSTNISVDVYILDDTDGTPKTGVLYNASGMDLEYRREGAAVVNVTEVTLASLTTAHADGGFLEIGHGYYRFDVPDAAFASGAKSVSVQGTVTGMVIIPVTYQLTAFDMDTASTPQTADHTAGIADIPTVSEFNARTLATADYFDPSADAVANVTLVATTTTNTDMRGTDSANTVVPPSVAQFDARTLPTASYFDPTSDDVAVVTLVNTLTTYTGNTPQTADHTAGIADIPTVSEFNARTLVAASYFDASSDGVIVTTNNDKTGYSLTQSFPTNFSAQIITAGGAVDSLIQGYLNTLLTESTAGRINDNFEFFYDNSNAQTTQVVDDVGGGGGGGTDWTASERNEIRGRLGVTGTTASGGNTPTLSLEATVAALNDISAADVNAQCDIALADYDGPTNAEMIARTLAAASYYDFTTDQVILLTATQASIDAIEGDTNELQGDDVPGLIAALNDVSTADVNAQCDIALSDYDGPTNAEMIARTLLAGSYYDFATDQVILLTATQASIDAIETDTGATLPALINAGFIVKNAPLSNFQFLMVLASDGVTPAVGLTVTGQRSLNAGSYATVGGTITEISNGMYQFDALSADTNADSGSWRFSAATANDTFVYWLAK